MSHLKFKALYGFVIVALFNCIGPFHWIGLFGYFRLILFTLITFDIGFRLFTLRRVAVSKVIWLTGSTLVRETAAVGSLVLILVSCNSILFRILEAAVLSGGEEGASKNFIRYYLVSILSCRDTHVINIGGAIPGVVSLVDMAACAQKGFFFCQIYCIY